MDGHQATARGGLHPPRDDQRVRDVVRDMQEHLRGDRASIEFYADTYRGGELQNLRYSGGIPLRIGKIVYSLPSAHWYKVQMSDGGGVIGCCALSPGGLTPTGPTHTHTLPANSNVLVWNLPGLRYGFILGTIPSPYADGRLTFADEICQRGQSGLRREEAYREPFRMPQEGHVINFGANRPADGTTLEWGVMAETGLGFHIDPFQLYMRVNEMCGLYLNYFDSHTRLAGVSLDVDSAVSEFSAGDDEGEAYLRRGVAAYPWEALGLYDRSSPFCAEFDNKAVQFDLPKGKIDLPDDGEDVRPVYRYQEHGGYLGQGIRRMVVLPAKETGVSRYGDDGDDMGVWEESVGLDGSYHMRSARRVTIGKRVLIPAPMQKRLPADGKGDDSRAESGEAYKFSGSFGESDEHVVGDVSLKGDEKHMLQVAGVMNLMAYEYNWRGLHAFHYHTGDYRLPEESDYSDSRFGLSKAQDKLDFAELNDRMYMGYPSPRTVKIDHRHEVDYFQREAFMAMLPDGSVTIGDGYGASITLSGGSIRLDCPGDVHMMPGRDLIGFGGDIVLRARSSLDATAGEGDLRLKAEKNMQMLAGNSGQGGLLLESRAESANYDFDGKIGEDVQSSGIMLKSKSAPITGWGSQVYLRTGNDDDVLGSGDIVLDASRGDRDVVLRGGSVNTFASDSAQTWVGPKEEQNNVDAAMSVTPGSALFTAPVWVRGAIGATGQVFSGSDMVADGNVLAHGAFASVTASPFVGELKADAIEDFREAMSSLEESADALNEAGSDAHLAVFPEGLYAEVQPGNDTVIRQAGFSYRDDDAQSQYNTQQFKLVESRWQMMARLGMGDGGKPWDEPAVSYQGRDQLPWPGKKSWKDQSTLLQVKESPLYADGLAAERPYDDAGLEEQTSKPSESFTVIR